MKVCEDEQAVAALVSRPSKLDPETELVSLSAGARVWYSSPLPSLGDLKCSGETHFPFLLTMGLSRPAKAGIVTGYLLPSHELFWICLKACLFSSQHFHSQIAKDMTCKFII